MKRKTFNAVKMQRRKGAKVKYLCLSVFIGGFISLIYFFGWLNVDSQKVSAEDQQNEIEKALFTRQEFFGAEAIVPFPTAEARENVARLAENSPDNPQIIQKLAELDEQLGKFELAEKELLQLVELEPKRLEYLAGFYGRRGWFEKEAATLQKMLTVSTPQEKPVIFEWLIESARKHELKQYLQPEFFQQVAKDNPDIYPIFEDLIKKLTEQADYTEALNFIRQAKANFPDKRSILLEKEVSLLTVMGQPKEAEKVYQAAFDVFWSDDQSRDFYDFLSNNDRLRAYGTELKTKFKQNPADFETALRLAHYRKNDYYSGSIGPVIRQLEKAKKDWSTEELIIVTRLLLQSNEGELASRFLYTLHVKNELKPDGELRAKLLYQLFKMFCEADKQKLPLAKGDLRFYKDVAESDLNPGITTGILSLVLSDSYPQGKLEEAESVATGLFNRAAAYRIFSAYKQEFPTSPELAAMYLDIVRIYTGSKEPEIAQKTLAEFEQRYENSSDYAQVAIKLADAYAATVKPEKEREILQKMLDYLGKNGNPGAFRMYIPEAVEPKAESSTEDNYYRYRPPSRFNISLGNKTAAITYSEVLIRLVNSLAKDKQTDKILELYSNEVQKYPSAEWLYEQRLEWLEKTNLTEEQLKVYRATLAKFPTRSWQDKLARWFVRQKRNDEFVEFSTELVGKLNDRETAGYLAQFIDAKAAGSKFDQQLYFKLYETAHRRFPHNIKFVNGLLEFYRTHEDRENWRKLSAEYYFESKAVRELFLDDLAKNRELRNFLDKALEKPDAKTTIYELFCADASVRLSNYEAAVAAYRHLNQLYPNSPEFAERLVAFTRSFGQKNREFLTESANIAHANAEFSPASADYRTKSGEIYAELGNYAKSREEWEKLVPMASGVSETYLDTATVYWDYFQYDDALRVIKALRKKSQDESLYAFQTGAILEAQHKQTEAVNEYVKALGPDEEQSHQAKRRLKKLSEKEEVFNQINQTVENQLKVRKDADWLALAYADFGENLRVSALDITDERKESIKTITASVLTRKIAATEDEQLLDAAEDFYSYTENDKGKQDVLKRLGEITENPRKLISYRLHLAESLTDSKENAQAGAILDALVQKYPTNYGVLTDSSDFYWRLGMTENALDVLETAISHAKGAYKNKLAFRLSKRFVSLNRLEAAEKILTNLHTEDPTNQQVFHELANVCIKAEKPELLRKAFAETVSALKNSDLDRRELDMEIADLREEMINAFTRLKDFNSAVEQHIEIINRDPNDEENVENAVSYVKRYGGAQTLLGYYQKTAAEAYKNYRWNVVLARIYEADKDWANAVKNYHTALINQPEMPELYVSLAMAETERKNYAEALKNIDKVLELTNDEVQYVRLKIDILKKAGRTAEIAAEKAKLPVEQKPTTKVDQFEEARKLQATEKEKAVELYRQAIKGLLENPLTQDFNVSDITGYVQTIRGTEPLNQINEKLWQLRDKLAAEAEKANSINAGGARNRLQTLNGAMTESIGNMARNFGTDEELAALYEDFDRRIDNLSKKGGDAGNLSFLQNICHRAGFGSLEEKVLKINLEKAAGEDLKNRVKNLVDFYNERGAYQKVLEVLEQKDAANFTQIAETAKLIGEHAKELEALRKIYQTAKDKPEETASPLITRYFEILYTENRAELQALTEKSSVYQLQLINFMLGKGDRELVHKAMNSANLPEPWKLSRNAETSLMLKEFDENSECYFCDALQIDSIGESVKRHPDAARHLIGSDWFKLSKSYGEWLYDNPQKTWKPSNYLTAMIENLPKNAAEQAKLGTFYLDKKDFKNALEHLRLAVELDPNSGEYLTKLGVAYYLSGNKEKAEKNWEMVVSNGGLGNCLNYLETLQKYDLAQPAQYTILPILAGNLGNEELGEDFKRLVRALAKSFTTEAAKTIYFQKTLEKAKENTSLPEMLVKESLIAEKDRGAFYEMLIDRSEKSDDDDYQFKAVLERAPTPEDAEEIYAQDKDYKLSEPESDRLNRQKEYLEYLLSQRQMLRANQLVFEIKDELKDRYARPDWLVLAEFKCQMAENKFVLSEAKRFVGIEIKADIAEIKPPSIERFNGVLQLLKDEKRNQEANQLFEAFFARMLAFERYEAANFVGLARIYFQNNEPEKAVKVLQIMVDVTDAEKRETALAELDEMESVKAQSVDKTKFAENTNAAENDSVRQRLKLAAEIPVEYGQTETSIAFRQKLLLLAPEDAANKYELAAAFLKNNNKPEAVRLLSEISKDPNVLRSQRWKAMWRLHELGETVEIRNSIFDPYSQFYNGLIAKESNQTDTTPTFFINSLIADKDAGNDALKQLIASYIQAGKPLAALKTAELDKTAKTNDLLDLLSETAEKAGEFQKAVEFEKARTGRINEERIRQLQESKDARQKRVTNFTVDLQNTRKL